MMFVALAVVDAPSTAAMDAPEKSADAGEKMICKKFLETGSLVKGVRVCKTKADWERGRDNIRAGFNASQSCSLAAEGGSCF